jgi:murein DD-endopeptidase MepM/ murein hydrolase activator NlpD
MKLQLTENQVKNLMWRLEEQETPKTGTTQTSTTGNTQTSTTGSTETSKSSGSGLQGTVDSYTNMMVDLATSLFSKTSGNTQNSVSGGTETNRGGAGEFAANIPPGLELMHPLGPSYKVTSSFGMRNIGGNTSKNHKGVDIGAPVGTAVYAPQDAVVMFAGDTTPNGCGGFVKLNHTNVGLMTKFCHLTQWVVKKGDEVKKGQLIGYSGGQAGAKYAGNSTGPHLHYEVLNTGGLAMNPTKVHSNMA